MKLFGAILIVAAPLLLYPALAKEPEAPVRTQSAVIVVESEYSRQGVAHNEAISIMDTDTLRRLEAFFPDYESSPSSEQSAGWERGYRVYFNFPKGKTLLITVSENGGGDTWSMGNGDLKTNGKFKQLVDDLRKRKSR